jgi:hypothetical protein
MSIEIFLQDLKPAYKMSDLQEYSIKEGKLTCMVIMYTDYSLGTWDVVIDFMTHLKIKHTSCTTVNSNLSQEIIKGFTYSLEARHNK